MNLNQNINQALNQFLPKHKKSDLEIVTYKDNDMVVEEGILSNEILFLVEGKIKVFKDYENGKTLLLSFYKPLTLIGDVEYIRRKPATCSVKAVGDIKVIRLTFEELDKFYENDYDFMYNLLRKLSMELLRNSNSVSLNLMYPLSARLASYILSVSQSKDTIHIKNYRDLSHNLGSSYRHLNRTVQELVTKNIIHKNKGEIKILDKRKLLTEARNNIYESNYEY